MSCTTPDGDKRERDFRLDQKETALLAVRAGRGGLRSVAGSNAGGSRREGAVGMSVREGGDLMARGRRDVLAAAILWSLSGVVTKSLDLDGLSIAFYRGL